MSANQIHRVKAKTATPSTLVAKTEEKFADVTTEEKFADVTTEGFDIVVQNCVRISKTCPVWTLKKCIEQCSTTIPRPCLTTYDFCAYAGDSVNVTYDFTPTNLSPGSFYISGTVIVTNTTSANKSIIIRSIRNADNTYSVTTQPDVKFGLSVTSGDTLPIEFIGLLPFNPCSTATGDVFLEYIVIGVTRVFLIKIPIDCTQELLCPCDELGTLQVGDLSSLDKGIPVIIPSVDNKYRRTQNIVAGTLDTKTGRYFCDGDKVVTNKATLKFIPDDATVCGPTICPVDSAKNTVTVKCSLPEVHIDASINTVYTSNWCICKSGEIVKPCPPSTACTYSHGYWKNHGPNSNNPCEDCDPSNKNVDNYPTTVQTTGLKVFGIPGTGFLNESKVCALLKASSATSSCISGITNLTYSSWNDILSVIQQYIAALLNVEKLKQEGVNTTCVDDLIYSSSVALKPFFLTFSDGKYTIAFGSDPASTFYDQSNVLFIINSLGPKLKGFNTGGIEGEASPCSFPHCGDPPTTPCELAECTAKYIKWTVDLSGATTYKSTSKLTAIFTPVGCIPKYDKTFSIIVSYGDTTFTTPVTIAANNDLKTPTSFDIDIPATKPLVAGQSIDITVTYKPQTFSTDTCKLNDNVNATSLILFTGSITPTVTCVAGSTSKLTDLVSFAGAAGCNNSPKIAGLNVSCSSTITDKCIQAIRDNTQLVISSSKHNMTPPTVCSTLVPITVELCPTGKFGNTLSTYLSNLVTTGAAIDIDALLSDFVPGFDVCTAPRCYDTLSLTFYTEIPDCACSVTNTATVDTKPVFPSVESASNSFCAVTINTGKANCVAVTNPIGTAEITSNGFDNGITSNMVPKFVKRR